MTLTTAEVRLLLAVLGSYEALDVATRKGKLDALNLLLIRMRQAA